MSRKRGVQYADVTAALPDIPAGQSASGAPESWPLVVGSACMNVWPLSVRVEEVGNVRNVGGCVQSVKGQFSASFSVCSCACSIHSFEIP